jgi:hypothetical protein
MILRLVCIWLIFYSLSSLMHGTMILKRGFSTKILSINENTFTWFDILAVQKCQPHCFRFESARLAVWIVTRSARFSSVRSGSVWPGSAYSVNEALVVFGVQLKCKINDYNSCRLRFEESWQLIRTAASVFPGCYLHVKYHSLAGCGYHGLVEGSWWIDVSKTTGA